MNSRPDNPYNNTTMLRNTNMFFGRTYLLQRIYSALANKQSISLVGLHHMGKSSLLNFLRLLEIQQQFPYDFSRYIFIFLDLREYLHKTSTDFFEALTRQIALHCQGRLTLERGEKDGESEFSSILHQIQEQDYHTVLLMDAFDNVTRNPNFDLTFFSFLRSQANLGKISYVTATAAPLDKVCHSSIKESPFFNIFGRYTLEPLAYDDAYSLATLPAAQAGLPFTSDEVTCILDIAGRHPFFIQRVCNLLFEEKCLFQAEQIDRKHFTNLAYIELEPHFNSLWERLSSEQQDILKKQAIFQDVSNAQIPELSESSLFRRFVLERFELQHYKLTFETVENALEKMQNASALGESDMQHLRSVSLRTRQANLTSAEKGALIREVLNEAMEHLHGNGYRTDTDTTWKQYNILYYRYFKLHLKNEQIVARMGFTSIRQFFRERKKAIEALFTILLEMENTPIRS